MNNKSVYPRSLLELAYYLKFSGQNFQFLADRSYDEIGNFIC